MCQKMRLVRGGKSTSNKTNVEEGIASYRISNGLSHTSYRYRTIRSSSAANVSRTLSS
jgi:hypothetical protein